MINGIEGIPGSGKSYEAVALHVLPALQSGRMVITNLPLNIERFAAIDPAYAALIDVRTSPMSVRGKWDASDIAQRAAFQIEGQPVAPSDHVFTFGHVWDFYTEWRDAQGRGPLFVIDECHVAFPKVGTPSEIVQWFKLHRHFNVDVLLLTQSFRDINQPIAQLIGMLIRCRKADVLGRADHYVRKVHAGYRGAVIQQEERKYRPEFFSLYKSHTQGLSVQESKARDVSPFLVKFKRFSWGFYALTACVLAWAFWPDSSTDVNGFKKVEPKVVSGVPVVPTAPQNPLAVPQELPADKPASVASAAVTSAVHAELEPMQGQRVHITGELVMGGRHLTTFVVSGDGRRIYDVTSVELEEAGYTWKRLGYCMGWLTYNGSRRAVTCDAPAIADGSQGRPVVFDSGTGRSSESRPGGVSGS